MKKRTVGWTFFLVVSLLVLTLSLAVEAKTIKIGIIGPMNFVQGKGHWNGATDGRR